MRRVFLVIVLMLIPMLIFAETYSQFEGRVMQVSQRATNLRDTIFADGYFERVSFETYVDSMAKLAAYHEFAAYGFEQLYNVFWNVRAREWGEWAIRGSEINLSEFKSIDNWGVTFRETVLPMEGHGKMFMLLCDCPIPITFLREGQVFKNELI